MPNTLLTPLPSRTSFVDRPFEPIMASSTPIHRDTEAKLQHILRTASQVFAQHGFEGASMRDISGSTGVSLSGLYYYFENKHHLLYLIRSKTFNYGLESLRSPVPGG